MKEYDVLIIGAGRLLYFTSPPLSTALFLSGKTPVTSSKINSAPYFSACENDLIIRSLPEIPSVPI